MSSVIIIGAGAADLNAACILSMKGLSVTVLEAGTRSGEEYSHPAKEHSQFLWNSVQNLFMAVRR